MADPVASAPTAPAAPVTRTPPDGLTRAQVAERRSRGLGNTGGERVSRSVAEILRANILTRFNFILGALLAVILAVGEPQDALFGIVLVANALIGIAQELRAKRDPGPAGRAQRASGPGDPRRRAAGDRRRGAGGRTTWWACAPATSWWPTGWCARPRAWRPMSRC